MTITLIFAWWWIPTFITVAGFVWAIFIYDDGRSGYLNGLGNLFMLIPVMLVSLISWIIAAVLKS